MEDASDDGLSTQTCGNYVEDIPHRAVQSTVQCPIGNRKTCDNADNGKTFERTISGIDPRNDAVLCTHQIVSHHEERNSSIKLGEGNIEVNHATKACLVRESMELLKDPQPREKQQFFVRLDDDTRISSKVRGSFFFHDARRSLRGSLQRSSTVIAELARVSVLDPSLLGPNQCSAIVVNYISSGYILMPYGEKPINHEKNHCQMVHVTAIIFGLNQFCLLFALFF